jgi:hypothetical protein
MAIVLNAVLYIPIMGLFLFLVLFPTLQMWQFAQLTQIKNPFRAFSFTRKRLIFSKRIISNFACVVR